MLVFTRPDEWQKLRHEYFSSPASVGFVPTMGALHSGHASLIRRAALENELCVVSIFVNPTQFDRSDDLQKYPRTLTADLIAAEAAGCDVVFAPSVEGIYGGRPERSAADYGNLTETLEAAHRPGHFDGVVTIVRKLLQAVKPDRAYFGDKDFQQLAVVRELVKREELPVQVVPCALVRDADGLALSSRNVMLKPADRQNALALSQTLREMKSHMQHLDPEHLEKWARRHLEQQPGIALEYIALVNEQTFESAQNWDEPVRALVAARVGEVRLIDNEKLTD